MKIRKPDQPPLHQIVYVWYNDIACLRSGAFLNTYLFFCPREKNTFYNEGMEYKPSEARES